MDLLLKCKDIISGLLNKGFVGHIVQSIQQQCSHSEILPKEFIQAEQSKKTGNI